MNPTLMAAAQRLIRRITKLSAVLGQRVSPDASDVLDRSESVHLHAPGRTSANQSCRLLKAADGWIALNLPRTSDWDLVPALLCRDGQNLSWTDIEHGVRALSAAQLVDQSTDLGLAACIVGETRRAEPFPHVCDQVRSRPRGNKRFKVVDLSSLWAGPLCAGLLAEIGADVIKVESLQRPDPTRRLPGLNSRLNGAKKLVALDFEPPAARSELMQLIRTADVLVTNARPRALDQLGLTRQALGQANPDLVHVAVTAHGWWDRQGMRVGFGDDAAAAGGLLAYDHDRAPSFIGDAVADPLTGLAATAVALEALIDGRAGLIDAALAHTAAGVATWLGLSGQAVRVPA